MARIFMILIVIVGLILIGCNKKQDEIDALQQEAADDDAAAVMDSLAGAGAETGEETGEYVEPTATEITTEPETAEPELDYSRIEGYVVQLGSYSDYELANYWAEKYQNREYPAFVREVDLGGETYYRLRVGVYDTFEEAKEVGEILVDRYSATYWIDYNR